MIPDHQSENFDVFSECLSAAIVAKLSPTTRKHKRTTKGRKNEIKPVERPRAEGNDVAELSDFVEYLSEELFTNLPDDLTSLSYAVIRDKPGIAERFSIPLDSEVLAGIVASVPPNAIDSLCSYGLVADASSLDKFLEPILNSYIAATTAPPPEYTPAVAASRPPGCEICSREHMPLTYHHLIPRQMHAKAVKRGWHKDWELSKVAWLCRACHSFVHKVATNEELAREYYDVDLLLEREDVQKFATWVGRVRWKAR